MLPCRRVGVSHRKAAPVWTLLTSEKEFLGELHLTQVRFCCPFSCQILLESFCLRRDYSPRLIPVLWAAWWTGGAISQVPWQCCEKFLGGELEAFHRAGAGAVIWKQKGALKNQAQEREMEGLNGTDFWTDPNGRGFRMYILKWMNRCWGTGVFLGKTITIWDGTKMKTCLMWQDWHLGHVVGSRLLPQECENQPSPKFLSERRDLVFLVFKADCLFFRFLDVSNSHDCFGEPLISSALHEAGQSCSYTEIQWIGNCVMILSDL